jgi:hypothetical protein
LLFCSSWVVSAGVPHKTGRVLANVPCKNHFSDNPCMAREASTLQFLCRYATDGKGYFFGM